MVSVSPCVVLLSNRIGLDTLPVAMIDCVVDSTTGKNNVRIMHSEKVDISKYPDKMVLNLNHFFKGTLLR